MPVERPHHRNMRHHRIAAVLADQHPDLGSRLPWRGFLFGLRQPDDVLRGVAERHQLAPVRQDNRIEKCLIPRQTIFLGNRA
jgi:hypothetical protein